MVRWAHPDDERALAELERQVPVQREWGSVTYNRPDALAQARLMGDVLHAVAELDGRLIGQHADVTIRRWLDGVERALLYRHHTRVLPAYQGQAIMPALTGFVAEPNWSAANQPAVHLFRAVGNAKVDAAVGPIREQNVWPGVEVHKLSFPVQVVRGRHAGRSATRADAGVIATILEQSHAHAHLCPRFDERWVADRFTRSPDDYGWGDVLVGDGAVLGVWDERLGLTIERDGVEERVVQATVLDWGARPGAEDELVTLLGAAASMVAVGGTTHVVLLATPAHPLYGMLAGLASEIDRFRVICTLPAPADVASRGVYADGIYF